MALTKIHELPLSIGAAAVYPYSEVLYESGMRVSKYDDPYNMFRIVGAGEHQRIWAPRNLARPCHGDDYRDDGLDVEYHSTFLPRHSEQARVVDETVKYLKQGKSFLVEAPTGFGKTMCAVDVIAQIGKKTLIVVTKEDIRDQWLVAIETILGLKVGAGVGLIQGDTCTTPGNSIVIAMVQSLAKEYRYPERMFKGFGLMVVDECHRIGADYFSQACYRVAARLRLGLSATPDRKDGRSEVIEAHIGRTLVMTEAMPMGFRVMRIKSPWQIPMVKRLDSETGQYKVVQLPHSAGKCGHVTKLLANHHGRNQLIARFVAAAYRKGRQVLVQSDLLAHLEVLTALIAHEGVPSGDIGHYARGLSAGARDVIKTKRVIVASYSMTAEATDIPTLDTLVMATPKSDVRQIVGRILRYVENKKEPVVFDIVDETSSVYSGYWRTRERWYKTIKAKVGEV